MGSEGSRRCRGGVGPSEDGAFSFLHPGVVFHQLGVEEGILGDAVLDPLHEPAETEPRVGAAPTCTPSAL